MNYKEYSNFFLSGILLLNCLMGLILGDLIQNQRHITFLRLINDIPTLSEFSVPQVEIENFLNSNITMDNSFKFLEIEEIKKKLEIMRCSYSLLSLYIMYHIIIDYQTEYQLNTVQLNLFSDIMHRIASIFYYIITNMTRGIWLATISIDALNNEKMFFNDVDFTHINKNLAEYCQICYANQNLPEIPLTFEEYKSTQYPNNLAYKLSETLMLNFHADAKFNEFYQFANKADVYNIIWKIPVGFEKFIPPRRIIPNFSYHFIETQYMNVLNNWKEDHFQLTRYTGCIKNITLLVTYLSLIKHFMCILKIYNILLQTRSLIPHELLNFITIPLDIFRNIRDFLNHDSSYVFNRFEYHLSSIPDSPIQLVCLIETSINFYNRICTHSPKAQISFQDLDAMIIIHFPLNFSMIRMQLESYENDMKVYYEHVKQAMSPVDFNILKILKMEVLL